ncbi:MAG: hypothetical protein GMKNLPBB_03198 [Myxococcota bacterium]|nr:hypothetical protein [Myxococcota bacterium]
MKLRGIISMTLMIASILALSACGDSGSSDAGTSSDASAGDGGATADAGTGGAAGQAYQPFSESNMAVQKARVDEYEKINKIRKEAKVENAAEIFKQILAAYQANDLQNKVAARKGDQKYAPADVGAFLDKHISSAIQMGMAAKSDSEIAYAGQTADKLLLTFFYYYVYHELFSRAGPKLDEAFGTWGLDFNGANPKGLAKMSAAREDRFKVIINKTVFDGMRRLRDIIQKETGGAADKKVPADHAEYNGVMEMIEKEMVRAFAYGVQYEFEDMSKNQKLDVYLIEARLFWESVEPWAKANAPDLAAKIIAHLYPSGAPDRNAADYFLKDLDAVKKGEKLIAFDEAAKLTNELVKKIEGK